MLLSIDTASLRGLSAKLGVLIAVEGRWRRGAAFSAAEQRRIRRDVARLEQLQLPKSIYSTA